MLLLEQGVRPLQLLQPPDLARCRHPQLPPPPAQYPVAHLLAPLRQHERMNVQRRRHRLHLDPGLLTQPHRRQLELPAVCSHLPWACPRHVLPLPSVR